MGAVRLVVAGDQTARVRDLLERAGMRVVAEAETEEKAITIAAERSAAAIVHAGAPNVHCGTSLPTVIVGEDADLHDAAALGAFAVLPTDCSEAQLAAAVELAIARFKDVTSAHAEAEGLRDQLESRKAVERAKGILMARLGLSEQDAYRRLQKASQDENRKMRDIAESIIRTEKIMGITGEANPDGSARSTG